MRFDDIGSFRAPRLDGVRVNGALREQEAFQPKLLRLFLKHVDEGVTDGKPLLLRRAVLAHGLQERLRGIHEMDMAADVVLLELPDDVLALVETHEPVVDVEQMESLRAQRLVQQPGTHGGVDAAGGQQEDLLPLALLQDLDLLLGQKALHVPSLLALADLLRKVLEHHVALQGIIHLRVELEAVPAALLVTDRREVMGFRVGGGGVRQLHKPFRELHHRVAVAHKYLAGQVHPVQDRALHLGAAQGGWPVLTPRVHDLSAVV
mmetsp:Transcript_22105/g.37493  ORF Transcript_22105/g.37493 Transcript_22105/m.37493 type:complete len:263 (-) Transcript_22105:310-1098(-)